jgi:hypothetical protein
VAEAPIRERLYLCADAYLEHRDNETCRRWESQGWVRYLPYANAMVVSIPVDEARATASPQHPSADRSLRS